MSSKYNVDSKDLTFPQEEVTVTNLTEEQIKQRKEEEAQEKERKRLQKMRDSASFVHLPNDPIYRPISDELLEVNELGKNIPTTTKIMINAALSDYVVFRKMSGDEDNSQVENVKAEFKRVNYDEFTKYQEANEDVEYINQKIEILKQENPQSVETMDKIRTLQKQVKHAINTKIETGIEVFFKKNKAQDIIKNKAAYDYNDLLLNIEIAFFRYSRSPFLRQISSQST